MENVFLNHFHTSLKLKKKGPKADIVYPIAFQKNKTLEKVSYILNSRGMDIICGETLPFYFSSLVHPSRRANSRIQLHWGT